MDKNFCEGPLRTNCNGPIYPNLGPKAMQQMYLEIHVTIILGILPGTTVNRQGHVQNMRQDFANNWTLVIVLGFDLYISFSLFEYVLIDGVVK